ncbi:hypothetical protein HXX76_009971 [Chlamydomonas incerta]|uniref:Sfi1 spindle body domain-containing protein n=1 Tax=Chlamydomonas incerta TaxID=51695 RepID=A0A835SNR9_CHLIN|nr:hypothetical protein HXX76_009971 [Chlamydomonas incerta]|eukprot:KAG2430448.1 hypothetical protein HXX76_009971 [Chlamydomonas incerta]
MSSSPGRAGSLLGGTARPSAADCPAPSPGRSLDAALAGTLGGSLLGAQSAALVQRMFRAVRRLPQSGSPEPVPSAYPGWQPQPRGGGGGDAGGSGAGPRRHSLDSSGLALQHEWGAAAGMLGGDAAAEEDEMAAVAAAAWEGASRLYLGSPVVDALAPARVHIAMGCASSLDPAAALRGSGAHVYAARASPQRAGLVAAGVYGSPGAGRGLGGEASPIRAGTSADAGALRWPGQLQQQQALLPHQLPPQQHLPQHQPQQYPGYPGAPAVLEQSAQPEQGWPQAGVPGLPSGAAQVPETGAPAAATVHLSAAHPPLHAQPASGAAAGAISPAPSAPYAPMPGSSHDGLPGTPPTGSGAASAPPQPSTTTATPSAPATAACGSTQQTQPAHTLAAATFEHVHRMLASLTMPAAAACAAPAAEATGGASVGGGSNGAAFGPGGKPPAPPEAAGAVWPACGEESPRGGSYGAATGMTGAPAAGLLDAGYAGMPAMPYLAAPPGCAGLLPVHLSPSMSDAVPRPHQPGGWNFDAVVQQSLDESANGHLRPPPLEAFSTAWASASAAWMQSVGRAAAAEREAQREAVWEVAAQLAEAVRERRHVEAYLEATAPAPGGGGTGDSAGIPAERLARLRALATASGAPPAVTLALLAELEDRLRLKAALTALRAAAEAAAHRAELLDSREGPGGPLAAAAWRCWWRAARWRLALRGRVQAAAARRQKLLAARVLLGWCGLVAARRDLAQRRATLTARFARQRLATRFHAWRQLCRRHAELRSILAACRAAAQRRALVRWRAGAARAATSARQRAAADLHFRRRLLLAALAHWRYLHVARSLGRVWEAALERRRVLALAGRALRVWHFYARRCRQLIRQLSSQRAAAAASSGAAPMVVAEAALPAPLQLAALPGIRSALLAAARSFMRDMSDELLHLRAFLRFTRPAPDSAQPGGGGDAAVGAGAGGGGAAAAARGGSGGGASGGGASLPARMSVALGWAGIRDVEEGGRGAQQGEGAEEEGDGAVSPRLLISGQWRHKQAVLLLLAQLKQVERMAAEVDAQLAAADRAGREARARLQERSEELQRRADSSRGALEAAHAEQQQLQADLEELDREAQAVVGYLSRCRAVSQAAAEKVRTVERQLAEAEAIHAQAAEALQAAAGREQEQRAALQALEQALKPELAAEAAHAEAAARQRQAQASAQAAAAAAALSASTTALEAAREGERAGRERLLAAQRRLSEALGLKSALMAHLREVTAEAAVAPRYAAPRHALRVGEAQSQVVEAAKVVSLAEFEVQELVTAVEKLSTATRAAEATLSKAQAAAAAPSSLPSPPQAEQAQQQALATPGSAAAVAAARVNAAAEQLAAACAAAAEAAELEQGAREAVVMLQARLQGLRQALQGEMDLGGDAPTAAAPEAAEQQAAAEAAADAAGQQQAVLLEPLVARQRAIGAELEAVRARAEAALTELRAVLAAAAEIPPAVEAAEVARRAQLLQLQPSAAKLQQSGAQLRGRLGRYPGELVRALGRVVEAYGVEACQDATGEWQVRNLPPQWQRRLRPGRLAAAGCASDDDSSLGLASSPVAWGRRRGAASPPAPGIHAAAGGGGDASTGAAPRLSPGRSPNGLSCMSAAQLARMARSALASAAARAPEARTDCSPLRSARRRSRSSSGDGTGEGAGGGGGICFGPPTFTQYPGSEGRGHKRGVWPQGEGGRRDVSSDSGEGRSGPSAAALSPALSPAAAGGGQASRSWRQQKKVARVLGFAPAASHDGPLLPRLPPAAPSSPRGVFARVMGQEEVGERDDSSSPSSGAGEGRAAGSGSAADPVTSVSFGGWGAPPQPGAAASAAEGAAPAPWPHAELAAAAGTAEHLNCEPPTSGVGAGPGAPCGDGGTAAVGGLVAKSVEDAACLFYLRKLSNKAFQALRSYAAAMVTLAAALQRAADAARLHWALHLLQQAVAEPRRRAAAFAAFAAAFRAWAAWRLFVQAHQQEAVLVALLRAAARDRLLRRVLRWWNAWRLRREAKLRADTDARDQHRRWLLLRWRAGIRVRQHSKQRKAAVADVYRLSLLRRCLRYWRHVLRARQLLHRVFSIAEALWEEYTDTLQTLGAEYCALRRAFDQLRRYRQHRAAKRAQRINEQAAVVFRESLLRVRAFSAWTALVAAVWQERFVSRLALRLLRAWRKHAHRQREDPISLCSLRARLRARGFAGERDVRRRWLQRCALAALGAPFTEPRRHYRRSLAARALRALWELPERRAGLAEEHWRRHVRGRLRLAVLQQWREVTERRAHIRRATALAAAWRKRRAQYLALVAWSAWVHAGRAKRRLLSTASLHRDRRLQSRALLAWARLRAQRYDVAVAHDTARRLRRCVAGWLGLATAEWDKREALIATMAELDGGAGLTAQPRRHRHLELYEQEQRACQDLLQQLALQQARQPGARQPGAQQQPEPVTGVLSPQRHQQRGPTGRAGPKAMARVTFLPTPGSGSSSTSGAHCPPVVQACMGTAGQAAARRAAGAPTVTAAPCARRNAPRPNLDWRKHGRALAPLNPVSRGAALEAACSSHDAYGATPEAAPSHEVSIQIAAAASGGGRPADVWVAEQGRQPLQPCSPDNAYSPTAGMRF